MGRMPPLVGLLLGVVTVLTPGASARIAKIGSPIPMIDGNVADPAQFPHVAHVFERKADGKFAACGGTVIGETAVLTAAHCVTRAGLDGANEGAFFVEVGSIHSDIRDPLLGTERGEVQVRNISKVVVHRDVSLYSNPDRKQFNDLALLLFKEPLNLNASGVAIARLPKSPTPPGAELFIAGWGAVDSKTPGHASLQWMNVTALPASDHYTLLETKGNACFGDSGGPVFSMDPAGVATLVGVASFFSGEGMDTHCWPGRKAVHMNVYYFVRWVQEAIRLRREPRVGGCLPSKCNQKVNDRRNPQIGRCMFYPFGHGGGEGSCLFHHTCGQASLSVGDGVNHMDTQFVVLPDRTEDFSVGIGGFSSQGCTRTFPHNLDDLQREIRVYNPEGQAGDNGRLATFRPSLPSQIQFKNGDKGSLHPTFGSYPNFHDISDYPYVTFRLSMVSFRAPSDVVESPPVKVAFNSPLVRFSRKRIVMGDRVFINFDPSIDPRKVITVPNPTTYEIYLLSQGRRTLRLSQSNSPRLVLDTQKFASHGRYTIEVVIMDKASGTEQGFYRLINIRPAGRPGPVGDVDDDTLMGLNGKAGGFACGVAFTLLLMGVFFMKYRERALRVALIHNKGSWP